MRISVLLSAGLLLITQGAFLEAEKAPVKQTHKAGNPKDNAKKSFVCKCVFYSLKKSGLEYDDGSSFSFMETLMDDYSTGSITKLDSYAKRFVEQQYNFGIYEGKNFMIRKCVDHENSPDLERLINSLEKSK